jgi:hypothetical protein
MCSTQLLVFELACCSQFQLDNIMFTMVHMHLPGHAHHTHPLLNKFRTWVDVLLVPGALLQIPPLLQLRPHRKPYKNRTLLMRWEYKDTLSERKVHGRCQGYFTSAGLEGWGKWRSSESCERFVGEWRAGNRYWGRMKCLGRMTYTGWFKNELQHGPTLGVKSSTGDVYDCEFDSGRLLSAQLKGT